MGPVPVVPASPGFRPLAISGKRRATLCHGKVHLQLVLSERPDRSWVEAFCQRDPLNSAFDGAAELPRIEGDQIRWSIPRADLMPAWWYLGRCVDRANSTSSRLRGTPAQFGPGKGAEHARLPGPSVHSVPRITSFKAQ